jgi:hypothetical protein
MYVKHHHTLPPTPLLILMHIKHTTTHHTCAYNLLPSDEPLGSEHAVKVKIPLTDPKAQSGVEV